MVHLKTTLEIDAPPERVWDVLADFEHYDDWNPFIRSIRASMEAGAKVDFKAHAGGRVVDIQARMLRVNRHQGFRWKGPRSTALGRVFRGEHYFDLEPLEEGRTRFIHGEHFGGLIPRLAGGFLRRRLSPAYEAMNRALKKRAEEQ